VTEIFESSLSIIILALIAGVRLVLYLRKRAAYKQSQDRPPPLAGVEAIEAEGMALAGDEEDENEKFSAWALSVESQKPDQRGAKRDKGAGFSPAVSVPGMWQPAETVPVLAGTRRSKVAADAFWKKLGALPPLRQGVILSEILGPPKGF
jgi:hypothetical protein